MTSAYSDIHRGFLQVVMSRGSISVDSANKALEELFAARKYKNFTPRNCLHFTWVFFL